MAIENYWAPSYGTGYSTPIENAFLSAPETRAYQNFFETNVAQPLSRQYAQTRAEILRNMARTGQLRSGVSQYPMMEAERNYTQEFGRQAGMMGKAQADMQVSLEEKERDFKRRLDMMDLAFQQQKQLLDYQMNKMDEFAWKNLWGQLAGSAVGGIAGVGTRAGAMALLNLFGLGRSNNTNAPIDWSGASYSPFGISPGSGLSMFDWTPPSLNINPLRIP
jgi:hypothetical protein